MYKSLLILKYLQKRRIAWVSLIAVTLCTAMVLVVISVMGGWLRMFRASFQGLSGDVIVKADSRTGFPYYQEMIDGIEARPEASAAVPMIQTFGLINVINRIRDGVQVTGIPLDKIGQINAFYDSLYLKNPKKSPQEPLADMAADVAKMRAKQRADIDADVKAGRLTADEAAAEKRDLDGVGKPLLEEVKAWAGRTSAGKVPTFDLPFGPDVYRGRFGNAKRTKESADPATYPGMIVGTGVVGINKRPDGTIDRWTGIEPNNPIWVDFTTLQLRDDTGSFDVKKDSRSKRFWIVDNSRTGVFQTDDQTVYVDFALLQQDVGMDAQPIYSIDPNTLERVGEPTGYTPARAGEIHVKLAPGVDLEAGRKAVQQVVNAVTAEHDMPPNVSITVETWEHRYGSFLEAVEKEKLLVTVLFSFISVVAIFLILCIFYMIVQEKVKDIGIVKSVGATNGGIALIFLGYGGAIGVVGGLLGAVVGGLIVHYINEIHALMGTLLGVQIWNAETYMFDRIPNTMNPREVAVIVGVAILSSVIGAAVPAWRAARLRPVDALRFE